MYKTARQTPIRASAVRPPQAGFPQLRSACRGEARCSPASFPGPAVSGAPGGEDAGLPLICTWVWNVSVRPTPFSSRPTSVKVVNSSGSIYDRSNQKKKNGVGRSASGVGISSLTHDGAPCCPLPTAPLRAGRRSTVPALHLALRAPPSCGPAESWRNWPGAHGFARVTSASVRVHDLSAIGGAPGIGLSRGRSPVLLTTRLS